MGLLIWLGAHFEAYNLGHTSGPLVGLCAFLGPFGGALMPQNVLKGPQVGQMYVLMCELENNPLTKSMGLIL
jgi:hypothetical protein